MLLNITFLHIISYGEKLPYSHENTTINRFSILLCVFQYLNKSV